jgi:hypothetical protein
MESTERGKSGGVAPDEREFMYATRLPRRRAIVMPLPTELGAGRFWNEFA